MKCQRCDKDTPAEDIYTTVIRCDNVFVKCGHTVCRDCYNFILEWMHDNGELWNPSRERLHDE